MTIQKLKSAAYLDKKSVREDVAVQPGSRTQCQHLAFDSLISVSFSILIVALGIFTLLCFIYR